MHSIIVSLCNVYDSWLPTKRASQYPAHTTSKNVVIGIVLGVIALITCGIIALLLWRLSRLNRQNNRRMKLVDLLAPARFSTSGPDDTEKALSKGGLYEKPLPPRPVSILTFSHQPSSGETGRRSILAPRYSVHDLTSKVPVIRLPSPTMHPQQTVASNTPIDHNALSVGSSSTPSHSKTHAALSLGVTSHIGSNLGPSGVESSTGSDVLPGRFKVVNVTESDPPRFQRPRLVYGNAPENTNKIRGRDAPFPYRKAPPTSITGPQARAVEETPPSEKQRMSNVPLEPPRPAYTVHVPLTSAAPPGSSLAPPRPRVPFMITASRPLSNVVVKEMRTVSKPDGTQGKGRMVTMSVFVEDSEASPSDIDASENRTEPRTESDGTLGQVLSSYVTHEGDLPPYTPRNESH